MLIFSAWVALLVKYILCKSIIYWYTIYYILSFLVCKHMVFIIQPTPLYKLINVVCVHKYSLVNSLCWYICVFIAVQVVNYVSVCYVFVNLHFYDWFRLLVVISKKRNRYCIYQKKIVILQCFYEIVLFLNIWCNYCPLFYLAYWPY